MASHSHIARSDRARTTQFMAPTFRLSQVRPESFGFLRPLMPAACWTTFSFPLSQFPNQVVWPCSASALCSSAFSAVESLHDENQCGHFRSRCFDACGSGLRAEFCEP